jgi:hypothetical protein
MPANPNAAAYFARCKGLKQSETLLQRQLCGWIKMQWPHVLFRSGMEGLHLAEMDAVYASLVNYPSRGWPDLLLFEPRHGKVGLAMELKRIGGKLYKKDGVTLLKNEHLAEQQDLLQRLAFRGWEVCFCVGYNEATKIITAYLTA